MAGSVTITETGFGAIKKVVMAWTSDGSGDVSGTPTAGAYNGKVEGIATIPSGGGTAPSDNYDVSILDQDGHDVLLGAGANRDTANTEYVAGSSLAAIAGGKLNLVVANAGAAKQGTVVLWIR